MFSEGKSFLRIYSIIVVGAIGIRMFFNKKPKAFSVAALIPTIVYLFNV